MSDGRASNGGKRSGAGRRPKGEEDIKTLLSAAWPRTSRVKAIKQYAKQAEEGDVKSGRLLFEYAYGKPKETVEVSGTDGAPIEIVRVEAVKPDHARTDGDNP